jgi:hypothetical protein
MSERRPPKGVQQAAQRAVRGIEAGRAGRNFTDTGRGRARQLAEGRAVSDQDVRTIDQYFRRHEVDKDAAGFTRGGEGFPSPGRVAWDAWGGDPGRRWARAEVRKLEG